MPRISVNRFGGEWTEQKLKILENYLDEFTKALKKQSFNLLYIDAFAGSGKIELESIDSDDTDQRNFIDGSANVALSIENKPFDELIFIEKDRDKCVRLEEMKKDWPNRNVHIEQADANQFLRNLQRNWQRYRGVLFLDPFGAQVDWTTLESIANYKALDTWILFPTSTISRMLPRSRLPGDISQTWSTILTRVFGDESWKDLYQMSDQMELFKQSRGHERESGVDGLINIYKSRLQELFGDRFLTTTKSLKNSNNSRLYEFMFCVGSDQPSAIGLATRIANHLLSL